MNIPAAFEAALAVLKEMTWTSDVRIGNLAFDAADENCVIIKFNLYDGDIGQGSIVASVRLVQEKLDRKLHLDAIGRGRIISPARECIALINALTNDLLRLDRLWVR